MSIRVFDPEVEEMVLMAAAAERRFSRGRVPVSQIVRGIVARTCPGRAIPDAAHLANDLKLDFFDRVELFSAIETRFPNVDFTEYEIAGYSTVGALIALTEKKVRAAG